MCLSINTPETVEYNAAARSWHCRKSGATPDPSDDRAADPVGWIAVPIAARIGFAAGYAAGASHHADCADNFGSLVGLIGAGIAAAVGLSVHLAVTRETPLYVAPSPVSESRLPFDKAAWAQRGS